MSTASQAKTKESKADVTVLLSVVTFIAAYFGARLLMELESLPRALHFVAAFLPAPAFLFFLWSMARAVKQMDELQRRIQLEALCLAWPLAVAMVMTISLLQKAGFLGWEPMWVYLPMTYFLGLAIAIRRYQ